MNFPLRPALALFCLLAAAPATADLPDRLERPSRPTPLAAQAPLTDLQRVGERLVMVGASGHVLLLDADGKLQQAEVPVDLLLTALHFVDRRNGWAVGHDGVILHSEDGGQSWRKQLDGQAIGRMMLHWAEAEAARLEQASAAAPDDEALSTALDNAYFALDDARAGIQSGPSRPLLDVWFRDTSEGWAVGAYGMIVQTLDGGRTWRFVAGLDNAERLHLNTVLGLGNGDLLVAGEGGRLHRSHDGGQTWQPTQHLTAASLYQLTRLADGRLLALGFGGTLLSSADAGASWESIPLPVRSGLYGATQLDDGRLLLGGQGGSLLASHDGRQFKAWRSGSRAALLGIAPLGGERLALVGSEGLRVLPLSDFKEQLQ